VGRFQNQERPSHHGLLRCQKAAEDSLAVDEDPSSARSHENTPLKLSDQVVKEGQSSEVHLVVSTRENHVQRKD